MFDKELSLRIFSKLDNRYKKRLSNKKLAKIKEQNDKFNKYVDNVDLSEVRKTGLDKDRLDKIKRRTRNNELIASYYNRYAQDTGFDRYYRKADRVDSCCSLYDVDVYSLSKIKDVKRTNLCEDRFCDNCQANRAKNREDKFTPLLDKLSLVYDLYR